jgi:hypothetical protein
MKYFCALHMKNKINWDALGITTSLACAIHCAVLPLVLSSFPVFGINIIDNVQFEGFMIFLAFTIGCLALLHGFRKHHRNILPILVFGSGILLLCAKQTWHSWQLWFLIPAVICILFAHWLNYSLSRKASHLPVKDRDI